MIPIEGMGSNFTDLNPPTSPYPLPHELRAKNYQMVNYLQMPQAGNIIELSLHSK
jgi:hypothetical protein